jgi:hypothetical protein
MTPLSLSSSAKARRIWVRPVGLIAASPAPDSVPLDQAPLLVALESVPAPATVAVAWKSALASAAAPPKAPVWTSICNAPSESKGLAPNKPTRWRRSVAAITTASSGSAEVSNDTKPFTWASDT